MSEAGTKVDPFNLKLHGLYEFKTVFADEKIENGAVAYNEKFEEAIVKLDGDWFFLETGDTRPELEVNLFKYIKDIADDKKLTMEDQNGLLQKITINYNLIINGEEKQSNILGMTLQESRPAAPKYSKEEYMKNADFGEF
jgi:hypothetical protein